MTEIAREPLWTSEDAARATGGEVAADWTASGVSIDSRTLAPGDLFAALKGPNHDGHDHVEAALESGAAAAMVERIGGIDVPQDRLLMVRDTVRGLRDLASFARARGSAKVCAITGSVGKTGTKEMLAAALGAQGKVAATAGNLNNHLGLPLSLARMPADCDYGVFEMGMNHAGEISPLSALARPHVAIITTVAPVHIEYFDDEEGIADAKGEIFDGLEEGGTVVLNRDNVHFDRLAERARAAGAKMVWGFGVHSFANARLLAYEPDATGARVEATIGSQHLKYRISMRGKHWALNSIAVLAAAGAMGADLDKAAAALADVMPTKGRGEYFSVALADGSIGVIDETYNASPIAMRAAFDVLAATRPGRGGRRVVVLGDMLELGKHARDEHVGLAADIKKHDFDLVFACGQYMTDILGELPNDLHGGSAATSAQLAEKVTAKLRAGDLVLVKGSAGAHMSKIIDAIRDMGDVAESGGDA
ncbi:MAG: UDP-N-acetylmuramoyl-tripeptide--D-alanyl-D-alanine ligase [Rhodospirillales bacterium]|nr:UDP-N-acetylmuramoyl-tripeptide--D-alanyl-D-alanine ligase [Rhodospirillales bacterium]MBO6787223.1 UDP-N-acetylmuramoyl-tripeptide--D-alanyl-D-alanine ligase [Rhodospirillales bacterium]